MLFNSYIFFIFLGVVLPVFYLLPAKKHKNLFLVFASYVFYGYWDWRFCFLLLLSTISNFYLGSKIDSCANASHRKQYLITSVVFNLGILCCFKYTNFFIDSFQDLVSLFGSSPDYLHLHIILPVGISFYTFQALSYTVDVYKREIKATDNLTDFALYISFFPQLVAGPIERASTLLSQLSQKLSPNRQQLWDGFVLIVNGLVRKVLIGDTAGRIVDNIFSRPEGYLSIELLCAIVLFSIQIYADFSGYSNIARGVAKLLGINLVINFNQPYFSPNITEFWRRWHISLATWLRDYVYIPLGGAKAGTFYTCRNVMITFCLCGLWHGAGWNFILWGWLHGLIVGFHKLYEHWINKKGSSGKREGGSIVLLYFNIILTYCVVCLLWLFFRAQDLDTVKTFLYRIAHWQSSDFASSFVMITISFLSAVFVLDFIEKKKVENGLFPLCRDRSVIFGVLTAALIVTMAFMFQNSPMPFIYFQF